MYATPCQQHDACVRNMRRKLRPRLCAVLVGIALALTVPFIVGAAIGYESRWYLVIVAIPYGVAGIILGLVWRDVGWRIGIWLFLVWPPALLLGYILVLEVPSDWRKDLLNFMEYWLILIAACLGGWIGSKLRETSSVVRDHNHRLTHS